MLVEEEEETPMCNGSHLLRRRKQPGEVAHTCKGGRGGERNSQAVAPAFKCPGGGKEPVEVVQSNAHLSQMSRGMT